jgi:hypothetical protein
MPQLETVLKRFESPDEVRTFETGQFAFASFCGRERAEASTSLRRPFGVASSLQPSEL